MNLIKARHQRLDKIAKELGVDKEKIDFRIWMDNALTDMETTQWNLQNQTKNG